MQRESAQQIACNAVALIAVQAVHRQDQSGRLPQSGEARLARGTRTLETRSMVCIVHTVAGCMTSVQ